MKRKWMGRGQIDPSTMAADAWDSKEGNSLILIMFLREESAATAEWREELTKRSDHKIEICRFEIFTRKKHVPCLIVTIKPSTPTVDNY
jgi:hypothetical protein